MPITKPHPFGLPFSFADIQSSHLDEGITAMMTTISMRDTAQNLPVYLAQRFAYQIVPLPRVPLSVSRKFYLKKKYTFSLDHHLKKKWKLNFRFPCGTLTWQISGRTVRQHVQDDSQEIRR